MSFNSFVVARYFDFPYASLIHSFNSLSISLTSDIFTLCVHIVPNGPEFSSLTVVGLSFNLNPKSILVFVAGFININCLFRMILTLPFSVQL